jgi:hypothetical protein
MILKRRNVRYAAFMFASPQIWDVAEGGDLCTTKLKNANMLQIPLSDLLHGDP